MHELKLKQLREEMVRSQILKRGITEENILAAFSAVPRHLFVPKNKLQFAYDDCPLPIGEGQTISQPYMVALMTQQLSVKPGDKILEIGTGSGYQAAILTHLGAHVYSVERIVSLAHASKELLNFLGFDVAINTADGTLGWQEHAPYDKIIVTAATPALSPYWMAQLLVGGKIIFPLGGGLHQDLIVADKVSDNTLAQRKVCGCVFVPLIGKYGYKE